MSATETRIASGDAIKRVTWRYQWWLAYWRQIGGDSSAESARYIRRQVREARAAARRSIGGR